MNDIHRYLSVAKLLIALILVIFLAISVGIRNIKNTFMSIEPEYGMFAACCLALLLFIGAFNVWLILRSAYPIPFFLFLKVYLYSWTISLITPGQAGDASLILLLKKYGIPMQYTGSAYAIDKAITLIFFFFIAWYGSYNFIPELKSIWFLMLSASFVLLIFTFLIIVFSPIKTTLIGNLKKIFNQFKFFKKKWYILVINVVLTVMKWLMLSLCYTIAFLAFDVYVKWPEIGIIPILSTLVGYIPISIGGIGTVELTASHLFSKVGVEQSIVLSAYLLLRALQFIMAIALLILFSLRSSKYEIKLNINRSSSKDE